MNVIRKLSVLTAASMVLAAVTLATPAHAATAKSTASPATGLRPIIFVHGILGNGSQVETQAKRFASNGYPASYIVGFDYNSLSYDQNALYNQVDALAAQLKTATGATQIDLMAHSLGTSIMQGYLNSSAARAAGVAHYVNIDGAAASSLPGGVPTLGIWGEGNTGTITGAQSLSLSNQSHVQTTTSAEAFAAEYRFFTGNNPSTTNVAPQAGAIQLGGRAINFPSNEGVTNGTLSVYQVNPATGQRTSQTPVYTKHFGLTSDGAFGPFNASGTAEYEFLIRKDLNSSEVHHIYYQPFLRTDLGIRLMTTDPGTGVDLLWEHSSKSVNTLIYRNKEFWGDQGAGNDTMVVNGTEILNSNTAPRDRRTIGILDYDQNEDGVSHVNVAPGITGLPPFISGTDQFNAASPGGTGSVTFSSRQRGGNGHLDSLVTPNWPSDDHLITVNFNDFVNS
jgi:hypothetical protein